jgi:CAAX prenyl protease-like protein
MGLLPSTYGPPMMSTPSNPTSPFQLSLKQGFLPYTAPLAGFLVYSSFESDLSAAIGYPAAYTLKAFLVAILIFACRSALPQWSRSGLGLAILFGILSCPVWIGLDWVQRELIPWDQLNFLSSEREGFAVDLQAGTPDVLGFLFVRMTGLVILVPLIEEIFWRGFLARFLIDENFEEVRPGHATALSYLITTLAFAAVHPEVLAALIWGAAIHFLWIRTQNLWACIIGHAVTNAALGGYILCTGSWHLW